MGRYVSTRKRRDRKHFDLTPTLPMWYIKAIKKEVLDEYRTGRETITRERAKVITGHLIGALIYPNKDCENWLRRKAAVAELLLLVSGVITRPGRATRVKVAGKRRAQAESREDAVRVHDARRPGLAVTGGGYRGEH